MIKSIFATRHFTSGFTHVKRHSFPGITLPPGEANSALFSLVSCLEHGVEEDDPNKVELMGVQNRDAGIASVLDMPYMRSQIGNSSADGHPVGPAVRDVTAAASGNEQPAKLNTILSF